MSNIAKFTAFGALGLVMAQEEVMAAETTTIEYLPKAPPNEEPMLKWPIEVNEDGEMFVTRSVQGKDVRLQVTTWQDYTNIVATTCKTTQCKGDRYSLSSGSGSTLTKEFYNMYLGEINDLKFSTQAASNTMIVDEEGTEFEFNYNRVRGTSPTSTKYNSDLGGQLGLAPSVDAENSIINQLFNQGLIAAPVFTLDVYTNYALAYPPEYELKPSTLILGGMKADDDLTVMIAPGTSWSVPITKAKFRAGDNDFRTDEKVTPVNALIDSNYPFIHLDEATFQWFGENFVAEGWSCFLPNSGSRDVDFCYTDIDTCDVSAIEGRNIQLVYEDDV